MAKNEYEMIDLISIAFLLIIVFVGLCEKYKEADIKQTDIWRYERPMKIWVRDNTPEDANFLIPLYIDNWKNTKRTALYDANVINAASYNKAFIADAVERYQALTDMDLKAMTSQEMQEVSPLNENWSKRHTVLNKRYDTLSTKRIIELRDKYDIKYFVTASKEAYPFPVVYKNEKYTIYDIKSTKEFDNSVKK